MSVQDLERPRLRHCTLVERNDTGRLHMIVGTDEFELEEQLGSRESLLRVKSCFDGRHSVPEIAAKTHVPEADVRELVVTFAEMGLLRGEEPLARIPVRDFLSRIDSSCRMWKRQIGFHRLFGALERGETRREVFVGLLLETYHYVASAPRHIAVALSHCRVPRWEALLREYFLEEHDHKELFVECLRKAGVPEDQTRAAHPLIGTLSLVSMLCEVGRTSTLAYLASTSLIEARGEDLAGAQASLERLAVRYGFPPNVVSPVIEHMRGDLAAGHSNLLAKALAGEEYVCASEAHTAVNYLHDVKHSFDQFHDQILQYYSDISNYVPRLTVDYFSL